MGELYLILHKVRGKPAFDVAELCDMGCPSDPGPWWIIPTSGHRAHPATRIRLTDIKEPLGEEVVVSSPEWDSLPDHYAASEPLTLSKRQPKISITGLLSKIGLSKPPLTNRRKT